jgi:hypothetical protein
MKDRQHNGQKKKVQKDKQRSTKHTHKTEARVTRTPLKKGSELKFFGRVSSSCSTSGTRRVNLATNPVISHEWGKDREVFTKIGKYPWSSVTQVFHKSSKTNFHLWFISVKINSWQLGMDQILVISLIRALRFESVKLV